MISDHGGSPPGDPTGACAQGPYVTSKDRFERRIRHAEGEPSIVRCRCVTGADGCPHVCNSPRPRTPPTVTPTTPLPIPDLGQHLWEDKHMCLLPPGALPRGFAPHSHGGNQWRTTTRLRPQGGPRRTQANEVSLTLLRLSALGPLPLLDDLFGPQLLGDFLILESLRRAQDDGGAEDESVGGRATPGPAFQGLPFLGRKHHEGATRTLPEWAGDFNRSYFGLTTLGHRGRCGSTRRNQLSPADDVPHTREDEPDEPDDGPQDQS